MREIDIIQIPLMYVGFNVYIVGVDQIGELCFVTTTVAMGNVSFTCKGNVHATNGCWSFLKGGFILDWSPSQSWLYFEVICSFLINSM